MAPETEDCGGNGWLGRKEERGLRVGGRDVGGEEDDGDRIGLWKLGRRSGRTSARQEDGAGGDGDLLAPAALCLFNSRGVCSGKHRSTEGEASEPPLTAARGTRVRPHTHLGGCGVPVPSAERGRVPAARVGV